MSSPKLLFYDLDGTLVDTREDIACAANHMLRQMGSPEISHDEVASHVGRGVFYLISGCLKSTDPKRVEKATKIYRDYYREHMLDHSRLFPGVVEMLEYFKDRTQIVLTNKPNPFSFDLLKELGVGKYFYDVIAGDAVYPKKPAPDAILAMQKKFGVTKENTHFIGDSKVDIETARNAGIKIGVITHGFSSREELESLAPDLLAENFTELVKEMAKRKW